MSLLLFTKGMSNKICFLFLFWVCFKVCLLFSLHTIIVFQVVSQRFRQHKTEAVATAIFLRFINPAISKLRKWKIWFSSLQIVYLPFIDVLDSPQMLGIVDQPPPDNIRRGLMFLSKVRSRNVFLSRKILFVYSTLTKFEVRYTNHVHLLTLNCNRYFRCRSYKVLPTMFCLQKKNTWSLSTNF